MKKTNKKPRSYGRFYSLLKRMSGDREEIKHTLVARFTNERTTSLREMSLEEYDAMCETIEVHLLHPVVTPNEARAAIKRHRSSALHRMQKLGVDTTDWNAVDRFCLSPRIAGKPFGMLTVEELQALVPKLEAILRKPRPAQQQEPPQKPCPVTPQRVVQVPVLLRSDQLPS